VTKRPAKPVPGSAKVGPHDTRSTDLYGRKADAVKPHTELASEKPAAKPSRKAKDASGEVAGALRDQVGKGGTGH
jgi:hypothetical protein